MKNKLIKLLPAFYLVTTNTFASIDLNTVFRDVYAQTGTPVTINCISAYVVANDTYNEAKFVLGTKVCAENKNCVINESVVTMKAGERKQGSYQTTLQTMFNRAGNKNLQCTNYVRGNEGKNETKYATAYVS